MGEDPQALVARLIGVAVPKQMLQWTTYGDMASELGGSANMSLATVASGATLVAYFFQGEGGDDRQADTVGRAFRDCYGDISEMNAEVVGVSAQTAREQRQTATNESFLHALFADPKIKLAGELALPITRIGTRDEYEPLTIIFHKGRIAHVIYPVTSPRAHISDVLDRLGKLKRGELGMPGADGTHWELAVPVLGRLRDKTGYTVAMAALDEQKIVVVGYLCSARATPDLARVGPGSRLPAYCTSLGKVLLAYGPVERDGFVEEMALEGHTEVTITDPQVLFRELIEVQHHGYAVSDGEYMPGLQGVAVVFRDASGEATGAVGVSAQSFEPPSYDTIIKLVDPLMRAGRDITARLAAWKREQGGETSG